MPELPEVETICQGLINEAVVGRVIQAVNLDHPPLVREMSARVFQHCLAGRCIEGIRRRGKYILFDLDGPQTLIVHLRMTGKWVLADPLTERSAHCHLVMFLDDRRELRYLDSRKFGRFLLTRDPEQTLSGLGPEPLKPLFSLKDFRLRTKGRTKALKALLLDQSFVAGIGNIYADEALWEARIHPSSSVSGLDLSSQGRLYRAIRRVLRRGLRNLGTSLGRGQTHYYSVGGRRGRNQDQLKVFRRDGEPCPRCRTPIEKKRVAGRGTHFCPVCQVKA